MRVLITVHNCRTQHSTEEKVLIILPLILRTIIIAQMMSTGGEGTLTSDNKFSRCRANKCDRLGRYRNTGLHCSKHTPPLSRPLPHAR